MDSGSFATWWYGQALSGAAPGLGPPGAAGCALDSAMSGSCAAVSGAGGRSAAAFNCSLMARGLRTRRRACTRPEWRRPADPLERPDPARPLLRVANHRGAAIAVGTEPATATDGLVRGHDSIVAERLCGSMPPMITRPDVELIRPPHARCDLGYRAGSGFDCHPVGGSGGGGQHRATANAEPPEEVRQVGGCPGDRTGAIAGLPTRRHRVDVHAFTVPRRVLSVHACRGATSATGAVGNNGYVAGVGTAITMGLLPERREESPRHAADGLRG